MSDDKKFITLKSTDGVEFSVDWSAAMLSDTVKNTIKDSGDSNVIPVEYVDSITMEKVIKYCNQHVAGGSKEELKEFDEELVSGLDQGSFYHLLVAANVLEIWDLVHFLEKKSRHVFDE